MCQQGSGHPRGGRRACCHSGWGGGYRDSGRGANDWPSLCSADSQPRSPYYFLGGVSARSGSDAWAVGNHGDCATATGTADTLIVHWNGPAWR